MERTHYKDEPTKTG